MACSRKAASPINRRTRRSLPTIPSAEAPKNANVPPSPTCLGISSCILFSGRDRNSLAAGSGSSHGPAIPKLWKFGPALHSSRCQLRLLPNWPAWGQILLHSHLCHAEHANQMRTTTSSFLTPVEQAEPDCNSFHNSHMQIPLQAAKISMSLGRPKYSC